MGYTIYWSLRSNFTKAEWSQVKVAANKLIEQARQEGVVICFELDKPKASAQVDDERIRFNGVGEEGHETFILRRQRPVLKRENWEDSPDGGEPKMEVVLTKRGKPALKDGDFCKTARKSYNKVVMGVLMVAQSIKGGKRIKFHADGGNEDDDYIAARKWVRSVLPEVDDGFGDPIILGAVEDGAIQVADGRAAG